MIRVEELSCRGGDFWVRDVSLTIESGEYFVLLGPTGSGKTLFVKCLCGLIRAESRRIRIDGEDVTELEPPSDKSAMSRRTAVFSPT